MAIILDGTKIRDEQVTLLRKRVEGFSTQPVLSIIQIGDSSDSSAYIRAKTKFGERIGVQVNHVKLPATASFPQIRKVIEQGNADPAVGGIIVQLPLPPEINQSSVAQLIDPAKDVDVMNPINWRAFASGESVLCPATARGVIELLKYHNMELEGKNVAVVGRSMLVGKAIALAFLKENATVTICHRKTLNLQASLRGKDIVVVAIGRPNFFTADYFAGNEVVVDVGINVLPGNKLEEEVEGRKLVGDVDRASVEPRVRALSPVPGGVGPMTVLALFENLLDMCEITRKNIV